jgi:hypothetical protein
MVCEQSSRYLGTSHCKGFAVSFVTSATLVDDSVLWWQSVLCAYIHREAGSGDNTRGFAVEGGL